VFLQTETCTSNELEATQMPERCVIVVDELLPPGKASNAAAVLALTQCQRHSHLVGAPLRGRDGAVHPGLIPIGNPVLRAASLQLSELLQRSLAHCDLVDFPVHEQKTTSYTAFPDAVLAQAEESLRYLAICPVGSKNRIGKLVGDFSLSA
jgi:hypothetical protein